MRWPFSRRAGVDQAPPWPPIMAHPLPADEAFVCSSCGRTDLPATGDWDPPICLECDAAINFDADEEQAWHDDDR